MPWIVGDGARGCPDAARRQPLAGAGSPPLELAGRDELRETVRVAAQRTRAGKSARSVLMVGLRGVGRTVLLDRMRHDAEASGLHTIRIEAPEDRSLPALLAPRAITKPIEAEGAENTVGAVERILADTRCCPYFLQAWGSVPVRSPTA